MNLILLFVNFLQYYKNNNINNKFNINKFKFKFNF